MAAKNPTKAQIAAAAAAEASAKDAAPGPALEEGATAPDSGAPVVAPTGAAPGADDSDGATSDPAKPPATTQTDGVLSAGGDGGSAAGDGISDTPQPGAADGAGPGTANGDAAGPAPTTSDGAGADGVATGDGTVETPPPANGPPADADALASAAAESTAAAFEAAAQNLDGLDPEGAAAATMAALLDAQTTQTDDETAGAEPVALNVWGLPKITDFPALLTVSNNTASRFSVKSVNRSIPPHESITAEFDWEQYENLKRSLAGPARLDKWDSLYGVQVKHEPDRTESND